MESFKQVSECRWEIDASLQIWKIIDLAIENAKAIGEEINQLFVPPDKYNDLGQYLYEDWDSYRKHNTRYITYKEVEVYDSKYEG